MKLNFLSKFYDNHSLSIVSRSIATELFKNGYEDFCITPLDSYNPEAKVNPIELDILNVLQNTDPENIDIELRHSYPPIWRHPLNKNTKVVYIQPWEFSKIPFEWVYKFDTFAAGLIVPSDWVRQRYLEAGLNPDKVHVIFNGYNPGIFNKEDITRNNVFRVVYVGCAQYRKGIDILLKAWNTVFRKADNVELIIKDSPYIYGNNNILQESIALQYKYDTGKISYIGDNLSQEEIAKLYKSCQVIVHPYRGEGFGMHIQEAMACGCYPIVSSKGPTDEFVNSDCGERLATSINFVDITHPSLSVYRPGDSYSMMQQMGWILEPNLDDLIFKLRALYHHNERKAVLDRVNNAKLYTWKDISEQYMEVLKKIHGD